MVVEAAQPDVGIALDVGGVRRAPVDARPRVAEHVKRLAAERITPFVGVGTRAARSTHRAPRSSAARSASTRGSSVASGRPSSIVDGSAREPPNEVQNSRVVLESPSAIRLHAEVRLDDVVVGAEDLNAQDDADEHERAERRARPPDTASARETARSHSRDGGRAWIAASRPSAAKFASIAEPP